MQNQSKEYDFFISHASEDKEIFVRPLAEELIKLGFKVWFDELTLKFGDSLFEEISNGIKKSNYGLVVISHNFLKKEWTKKELNGLITKEIFSKQKTILPIWLNISQSEVYELSPILADKVSIPILNNNIETVIAKILTLTDEVIVERHEVEEKVKFLTSCDEFERKKYVLDTETRFKNLVHFEEAYYEWYCADDTFGGLEWDDYLAEKKKHELLKLYNLPKNVTFNPEFEPGTDMNLMIKLTKKWILKKATVKEIYEMIFLIDHYHELDLPYILWGFTADSLCDFETRDYCFYAPFTINEKHKITDEKIAIESSNVWKDYYGRYEK
ncbi:toll/interleukin-1 receptor domain-containing protein [Flavobacterium sp. MAHUQ-51]|uniref:toll/interleukin-1 receptor domain-containing protein n=1 Tax=Flavobacterium sp. GCM10022190 TaxID=3252639 RepID=UPI0036104397